MQRVFSRKRLERIYIYILYTTAEERRDVVGAAVRQVNHTRGLKKNKNWGDATSPCVFVFLSFSRYLCLIISSDLV